MCGGKASKQKIKTLVSMHSGLLNMHLYVSTCIYIQNMNVNRLSKQFFLAGWVAESSSPISFVTRCHLRPPLHTAGALEI